MNYSLHVVEEAIEETAEAYIWYEGKQIGLGERFLAELENTFVHIQDKPLVFKQNYRKVRIAILSTFPFMVIFTIKEKEIVVHSVFHTSRNPKVWRKRVRK
jgi:hypothetical protein